MSDLDELVIMVSNTKTRWTVKSRDQLDRQLDIQFRARFELNIGPSKRVPKS